MPHPSILPSFALFAPFEQLASLNLPLGHGKGHGLGHGPVHELASVSNALFICVASLVLAQQVRRHEDLKA